jgi:hypothetical protein
MPNSREQTCSRFSIGRLYGRQIPSPVWSRLSVIFLACNSAIAPAVVGQSPSRPLASQLILLDGSAVPFRSLEIKAGRPSGDGVPADLTLDDLRRIELAPSVATRPDSATAIIELRGSGRLMAKSVAIVGEKCRIAWAGGEELSLPVDSVRAIRFEPGVTSAEFDKAFATPSAELDRMIIKDEAGKLTSALGVVEALDAESLKIEGAGEKRVLPRSKLFAIVIAQPAITETPPHCLVAFRDGSVLGGETLSLAGEKATLDLLAGGKIKFSWSAASRVTIRSSRVAFLSDLKPVAEEQQAIVTWPLPAQRDKSVGGKSLMLCNRVYEKGLGVHARSSLTFAADKKWDAFSTTIGIDAEANGKGDCMFIVLADGQTLLKRRMKGTDVPEEIQLSITGRDQVTLLVEPGEGLDLADHADWCDARFIKNK